jgi:hypothetical protein
MSKYVVDKLGYNYPDYDERVSAYIRVLYEESLMK